MKQSIADQAIISQGFGHAEPEMRALHVIVWSQEMQCQTYEHQDYCPRSSTTRSWFRRIIQHVVRHFVVLMFSSLAAFIGGIGLHYWHEQRNHVSTPGRAVSVPRVGKTPTEELVKKVIEASKDASGHPTKSGSLSCYRSSWKTEPAGQPQVNCEGAHVSFRLNADGNLCDDIHNCVITGVD